MPDQRETSQVEPIASMNPEDALIAIMVAVAASDEEIKTIELILITRKVNHLPLFAEYDIDRIENISQIVYELFEHEDGIPALFDLVRAALPERLYELAYALACDVAAADGRLMQTELRFLEELRHEFNIPRLQCAALELASRVHHQT